MIARWNLRYTAAPCAPGGGPTARRCADTPTTLLSPATGATPLLTPTFPLARIYAMPYASNIASAQVLEKAGFALEGLLRRSIIKHGVVQDQFMYSRIREPVPAEAPSNPRSEYRGLAGARSLPELGI